MTEQFQRALELNEQIVLITGGARGLGAALSRAFAAQGARVIVNYHKSEVAAHALVAELGSDHAFAIRADVTDRQSVDQLFATARTHFGAPISTVVNNALIDFTFNGDARPKADTISWADFDAQLRGSVSGTLNTTQAAIDGMRALGFGRIITVGTNLVQNPVVPYHDYTAAKAALLALTRTFSADLGPDGITVNMISGGLLRTTDASAATPEAVFDMIAESTPLRKVTTPSEFADAALFFASPWSRAVTGQNLVVDGGLVKN
ncbi:3-oxoacyl-ACP reductase [Rhodococcus sp. SRB_17]|uniref:3-oxoacyl-ACP reductase n=1 Tax=Rhodococcus sp. OK302 TaxID=1882769 RepID=UPI000B93ABBB|nr:3-oxoacyl-ACP reductase [Rhodococcus sp. OK302]NMM88218.1 3-oxoacyl-ACP reductase [Rhodococcus sp. SRB_17]OYD71000.1 3-oxoacyl-[acyl-carrier protein] reductase [Rhodococcus sp. OK302]